MNRKIHVWFGKGLWNFGKEWKNNLLSSSDLLDNRKQRILNTIQNSEELHRGAIEQLEKARSRLRKVETKAEKLRVNGYSEIEQEKLTLINSNYKTLEQLENYKNKTIQFEQQREINQVRQQVFQQALR
ncbi:ATP synthase subunit b, chloroplastic [Capsicum annuum]|nr:ATP synthase subunit b, chloroplastic [Capsicum annuum]KAF3625921.1 ATP synthase subunit b, chloroplastic [Capsicum annuum]